MSTLNFSDITSKSHTSAVFVVVDS